mmetsp:Transcript_119375/g.370950  ORF Transcript_119375/g.370950 Transcript_119375/m.370950 type:complete len:244 (-) Transcript_119375:3-734(-)
MEHGAAVKGVCLADVTLRRRTPVVARLELAAEIHVHLLLRCPGGGVHDHSVVHMHLAQPQALQLRREHAIALTIRGIREELQGALCLQFALQLQARTRPAAQRLGLGIRGPSAAVARGGLCTGAGSAAAAAGGGDVAGRGRKVARGAASGLHALGLEARYASACGRVRASTAAVRRAAPPAAGPLVRPGAPAGCEHRPPGCCDLLLHRRASAATCLQPARWPAGAAGGRRRRASARRHQPQQP